MPALPSVLRRLLVLPVWRALGAMGAGLVGILLLRLVPGTSGWPLALWALLAGVLGGGTAGLLRLGPGWKMFVLLTPAALFWQLGNAVPSWLYPALLGGLLLVFGGGLLTRVPLYNSNRRAWEALAGLLQGETGTFVDLGAGLGGPLAFLARRHPGWVFRGVEASPVVWLAAWLRCRADNCRVRWGTLWTEPLEDCDVAYAFLSPAPMADLWIRARCTMRPGSLLISHSFEVPGVAPEQVLSLGGRKGACLRIYRVP